MPSFSFLYSLAAVLLQGELFYDIALAVPPAKKATVVLSTAEPGQMRQGDCFLFFTRSVLRTAQFRKHSENSLCVYLLSELFLVSPPSFVEAALG